ncbi:MAG: thioredoxin domain-containing protein [Chitinophagaceae bacterium]|nr:thioredoxin domain-containing protein [Chitinophagaceae bacterium]
MLKNADTQWGGFGNAPKFPQTGTINYLLRYFHFTKNEEALAQALLSLNKMAQGGIYDQIGGGFARYSTDTEWLAPHFEKMLYDNALLISVYSEAYQLTKNENYQKIIADTIAFVERELMSEEGGFYSALDADSEGVEGKFYTWSEKEIDELLGEQSSLFKEIYNIQPEGNWEHTNILWLPVSIEEYCQRNELEVQKLQSQLQRCRQLLFEKRKSRIRPLLDDKIILGWNALFNKALSKAFAATGEEAYRKLAVRNMNFLWSTFQNAAGNFHHTYKQEARYPAFLEDLAFLADALLHLQEVTGHTDWLLKAEEVVNLLIRDFSDEQSPFFFYTPSHQTDVIVRKKEVYDGAVPSGNSVMAGVLHRLSLLLDRPDWGQKSQQMVKIVGNAIKRYPTSFGNWACTLQETALGTNEITLIGQEVDCLLLELLQAYIPHRVLMSSVRTDDRFPMLRNKITDSLSSIWLCRNFTCQPPIRTIADLLRLIEKEHGNKS